MMVSNEVIYSSILIGSVLLGFPLRNVAPGINRKIATAAVGFLFVFGVCFWDGFYSLITILVNIAIIKSCRRNASFISFLWCFIYLLFFRCAELFSLPRPTPLANAVQLLLTLKLVSVAIEIHDYRNAIKTGNTQTVSKTLGLSEEPSAFDIFCYSYCYPGMFTGPFFRYRTYFDYVNMDQELIQNMPWRDEIIARVKQIVVFAVLYFIAAYFFNIEYVKTDLFYENSLWYRLFYMVPIFFLGRMRFYSAWLLAECSFISLVLGAYPTNSKPRPANGPTLAIEAESKEEDNSTDTARSYSFDAVRNVDAYGCDFSPTVRLGMRNWNMGVQWWLANHVHKRWPNSLKQFRNIGVLTVSAYWHGIDPGYFGAFLTMVIVMLAEDLLVKVIKNNLPESMHQAYDWCNWFAKMRAFEYMYMAFALLSWRDTYRYWKSVYFWLHISCILIILMCTLALKFTKKKTTPIKPSNTGTKKDD